MIEWVNRDKSDNKVCVCIFMMYMNKMNMNEGSINVKEETKSVMVILKEVIEGMYRDGLIRSYVTIKNEDLYNKVLQVMNDRINERIKGEGISGVCNVLFFPLNSYKHKDKYVRRGGYKNGVIYLAADVYIVNIIGEDQLGDDRYVFNDKRSIQYDDMSRTLEHELVHYQQDMRSKGEFFKGSEERGLSDDEMKELIKRKKSIDKSIDDEEFIKNVRYYNDESELDSFANNAADKYVHYMLKQFSIMIKNYIKRTGESSKREYSGDDVKRFVLSPIYNAKEGGNSDYYNLRFLKNKLKEYHKGYKYLTVNNRKKWWRYVIKALLNHKFDSMVF